MDMPIMDQVGISISPGSMVQIAVSPTLINITQSAFERFDAKERNCYMSDEIELPHFKYKDDYNCPSLFMVILMLTEMMRMLA